MSPIKKRLIFLDVIRALSVVLIIIYHFDGQLQAQAATSHIAGRVVLYGQAIGDLGVSLFIMISGAAQMTSTQDPFRSGDFFKKRFLAIFPSYWIAYLAVSIILFLIRHGIAGDNPHWTFILTIIGMDGFLGIRIPNYYLIGEWFTGFILATYLFFPLLRFFVLRQPTLTIIVTVAVAIITYHFYANVAWLPAARNPLIRMPEFLFGMVFVRFLLNRTAIVFTGSLAILAIFWFWIPPVLWTIYPVILDIAIFSFIASIVQLLPAISTRIRGIDFASKYAFLAFLVHHQIIYNIVPLFNAERLSKIEVYYLLFIVLLLSFAIAFVLNKPVDRITNRLKDVLLPRARAAAST